ncbi:MAG: hypothetical protein IJX19_07600, partial [Clostridia bacterium]|nr:hypothetical protein [Clostridia bacterium]
LTEDEVYCCPLRFDPDDHTRKLTVGYGDEVSCRAWIRSDGYHGADMGRGDCFDYEWTNELATMKVLGIKRNAKPRELIPAIPEALSLPTGKALAEYAEPAAPMIRRLAVLCDGCADSAVLEKKARELVPEAEEILMFVGENDGSKGLHNYLFYSGEKLLNRVADAKPDAVLVALGGNDCGKNRADWFVRNFVSCSTTLVNATRGFYVRQISLIFTMPILTDEQKVDQNIFAHILNSIADTLHAPALGIPEEIIPESLTVEKPSGVTPRADAIKIAVVGDQFSDKSAKAASYAVYLQELLGDGYDVYLYAKHTGRASKGAPNNYLKVGASYVKEMKALKVDAVVSMFGCADLRHVVAENWESKYRADFAEGFNEVLKTFEDIGAKNIVITPFDRKIADERQDIVRDPNGIKEDAIHIAKEHGSVIVDFFTPTFEREGLIEQVRNVDTISADGVKLLAELVAEAIKKTFA